MPLSLLLPIAFALLLLRAWPRLLYPEVWDEDGTLNLCGYLTDGFGNITQLINGYLVVVPKLITIFSASISFTLYPLISTLAAWALTMAVFVILTRSPLHLKGGVLLPVLCMLVPSDPEIFGLPLYSTWWATLLLFALVFWDARSPHLYFRLAVVALASLSSPFCMVTLPLFLARAFVFRRNRTEIKLAAAALLFAGVQLWAMWPIVSHAEFALRLLPRIIPVFMGSYAVGNLYPPLSPMIGLAIFAFLAAGFMRDAKSWVLWAIGYLWIASVLISISRVSIYYLHPVTNGPRYFFFPFIMMSWALLQVVMGRGSVHFRTIGACLLGLSVINAIPCLDRRHDSLNWRSHVSSCAKFPKYSFPVHFDGNGTNVWYFSLEGGRCAELLKRDAFGFLARDKSYPYTVVEGLSEAEYAEMNTPGACRIVDGRRRARDFRPVLPDEWDGQAGYEMIGRFSVEKSGGGAISIRLRRGQRVLLRSRPGLEPERLAISGYAGTFLDSVPPAPQWTVLEFSNRLLPEEFILQIK